VRASVLDAFSQNYKDHDRRRLHVRPLRELARDQICFDMHCKYCDVMPLDDVTAYFDTLERGTLREPGSRSRPQRCPFRRKRRM